MIIQAIGTDVTLFFKISLQSNYQQTYDQIVLFVHLESATICCNSKNCAGCIDEPSLDWGRSRSNLLEKSVLTLVLRQRGTF